METLVKISGTRNAPALIVEAIRIGKYIRASHRVRPMCGQVGRPAVNRLVG